MLDEKYPTHYQLIMLHHTVHTHVMLHHTVHTHVMLHHTVHTHVMLHHTVHTHVMLHHTVHTHVTTQFTVPGLKLSRSSTDINEKPVTAEDLDRLLTGLAKFREIEIRLVTKGDMSHSTSVYLNFVSLFSLRSCPSPPFLFPSLILSPSIPSLSPSLLPLQQTCL